MPTVWRIVPEHRAETAFDGEGARLFGGRWNSRGTRMVYCSESRALAALEILVHLTPQTIGRRLRLLGVELEEELIAIWPQKKLPPDWRAPSIPAANRKVGDQWTRQGQSAVLKIPSAVIPEEFTYLLNPNHPRLAPLRVTQESDFALDGRLLARG